MRCEEIMKDQVQTVGETDTAQAAAEKMRSFDIGFLPVCDEQGRAVGTITDRDVALRVAAEDRQASGVAVRDVMTAEVVSCRPEDDLRDCERLMARHHKSRMIVCDGDGRVRGVISLSDIAQKEEAEQAAATLREVAAREAQVH